MKGKGYQLRRMAAGIAALGMSFQLARAQAPETVIGEFSRAAGGDYSLQSYSVVLRPVEGAGQVSTLYRTSDGRYRLETAASCRCFDGKNYRSREAGAAHPAAATDVPVGISTPAVFDRAQAQAGVVDDNGTPCYRVAAGTAVYYLNPKTFLPYKVVRKTAGGKEVAEHYADYRTENGHAVPHYVRSGGKEYVLTDFRMNPDLPADWFACGKAK